MRYSIFLFMMLKTSGCTVSGFFFLIWGMLQGNILLVSLFDESIRYLLDIALVCRFADQYQLHFILPQSIYQSISFLEGFLYFWLYLPYLHCCLKTVVSSSWLQYCEILRLMRILPSHLGDRKWRFILWQILTKD